jgi:DNA-binding NtrC family response regulator
LATLGYIKTKHDAELLLSAGVEMICLNFGWNAGGSMGIGGAMDLAAAHDHARRIVAMIKRADPGCLCFVEGGPIILPKDAIAICDASGADGYIGGSTLDRLPLEMAVMQTASAFKAASVLRMERIDASRERSRISGVAGLIGQSEAMERLVEQVGKLARTELSVCISGEPGSGKTTVARAIHVASRSLGPFIVLDAADPDIDAKLFGQAGPGLLRSPDGHLVIENVERLSSATTARLLQWVERGIFERFVPQPQRPQHARLIVTTAGQDARANELVARLASHIVEVPALRARLEDVPVLARAILAAQKRSGEQHSVRLSSDGMRELLRHGWPGNVRELASVLARATATAPGGVIDGTTVAALLNGPEPERETLRRVDERGWISEALARHRFRRAETAAALGLSRKTLYNKMKRYGLIG